MSSKRSQWKGLQALVQEAVEHGSKAIERIQLETARRPFAILEQIPPIAPAARLVHAVYDASVIGTHAVVRGVNEAAGGAVGALIDAALPEDR